MKQIRINIVFSFLLLFSVASHAITSISGVVKNPSNNRINLIIFEDFITYTEKLIQSFELDSTGKYILTIDNKKIKVGKLKIGNYATYIHIEPNTDYVINLEIDDDKDIGAFMKEELYMKTSFEKTTSQLNEAILDFNKQYDDFLADNIGDFVKRRAKTKIDTFNIYVQKYYEKIDNTYFKNYMRFALALMELNGNVSKKKLYQKYLANQPVLIGHDGYMSFFQEFYHQFFMSIPLTSYDPLVASIRDHMSWDKMEQIAKQAPFVDVTDIRELVLIKALSDNFHHPEYTKKGVRLTLLDYAVNTENERYKNLARKVVSKNYSVDVGSYAPNFKLKDQHGNELQLSALQGKYVYLEFWATWCKPCVKEMKIIPDLKKKYGKYVEFVSVSIDRKEKRVIKFLKKHKDYNWHFAHFADDEELRTNFKVKSVPLYYLIDPYGKIVQSPAFRPTKISPYLEAIKNKMKAKKPKRKGWR